MSILVTSSASLPSDFASARLARSTEPLAKSAASTSEEDSTASSSAKPTPPGQLTAEAQQRVAELKQIDRKVRAHEQAHLAVGRELIRGGASFTYETGPDKRRYAVGGEVSIDASKASTPAGTITKAERIRATALAPAEPSAQDRSVAAQANNMAAEARVELSVQQRQEAAPGAQESPDQGSFYRSVEQGGQHNGRLGALLDSFA